MILPLGKCIEEGYPHDHEVMHVKINGKWYDIKKIWTETDQFDANADHFHIATDSGYYVEATRETPIRITNVSLEETHGQSNAV